MRHKAVTAILLGIFSLFAPAQDRQSWSASTFAQIVEQAGGQMPGSVRTKLKNDSHIFLAEPASGTGHSYMSFNSLGKSSLTPETLMRAIKAYPSRAFPYFDADGGCGQTIRAGNVYSLNYKLADYRIIENPVRVTGVGTYHFTFSTLPGHTLEGSATHGIFQDSTGELWLFQIGRGVSGEAPSKQNLNYEIAEFMWSKMAENIRKLMATMKNSDRPFEDPEDEDCLSGEWKGTLYQGPGGTQSSFDFRLELIQDGREVTGKSYISVIGRPMYFAVMKLTGTFDGDVFTFREGGVVQQKPEPLTYWCIKSGKLKLSRENGRATLSGDWRAGVCSPGSIKVEKVSDPPAR